MLPTAFRSFRAGSQLARSILPAGVDSLCDPLQRLIDSDRLIYYSQRNTIPSSSSASPFTGWAYSCIHHRAETAPYIHCEKSGTPPGHFWSVQLHQRRWHTDHPAVKSDDVVVYEGPLKQAVLSLKVRARSLYCAKLPSRIPPHSQIMAGSFKSCLWTEEDAHQCAETEPLQLRRDLCHEPRSYCCSIHQQRHWGQKLA